MHLSAPDGIKVGGGEDNGEGGKGQGEVSGGREHMNAEMNGIHEHSLLVICNRTNPLRHKL